MKHLARGVRDAELLAVGVRPRSDMSDDGETVVGNSAFGRSQGFLWSVSRGLVALQPLPGHAETEVTHLGASGRVAAGVSRGAEVEAVLWDETGEPRALRTLLADAGVDIGDVQPPPINGPGTRREAQGVYSSRRRLRYGRLTVELPQSSRR